MKEPFGISFKPETIELLKTLNEELEKKSGLKVGVSAIVEGAVELCLSDKTRKTELEKSVVDNIVAEVKAKKTERFQKDMDSIGVK